jgi:ectoine hydroxylase-related dioxygenase (phytanoyl-CoA dioxygenase family)
MVLAGSHRHFQDLALAQYAGQLDGGWERDWKKMNDEELEYYKAQGCQPVNVKCSKGSMVLWDSRTVHMSRPNRHDQDERLVVYVCGFPESRLSSEAFQRREQAFQQRRATSHWPDARHLFPPKPRWFGDHDEAPQQTAEAWISRKHADQ